MVSSHIVQAIYSKTPDLRPRPPPAGVKWSVTHFNQSVIILISMLLAVCMHAKGIYQTG